MYKGPIEQEIKVIFYEINYKRFRLDTVCGIKKINK